MTREPLNRTEKLVLMALIVSVLVAVLIPSAFYLASREQRRQDDKALQDRRIESCKAFNKDQTNDRRTAVEGLRHFAITFLNVTDAEADEHLASPEGREFVSYIADLNPYRTCTPECVVAEFDPDLKNCGPADNEKGLP